MTDLTDAQRAWRRAGQDAWNSYHQSRNITEKAFAAMDAAAVQAVADEQARHELLANERIAELEAELTKVYDEAGGQIEVAEGMVDELKARVAELEGLLREALSFLPPPTISASGDK